MWHEHLAYAGWKPTPQIKSDCYIPLVEGHRVGPLMSGGLN